MSDDLRHYPKDHGSDEDEGCRDHQEVQRTRHVHWTSLHLPLTGKINLVRSPVKPHSSPQCTPSFDMKQKVYAPKASAGRCGTKIFL